MPQAVVIKLPLPMREGWVELVNSNRWHFVRRSRALCGLIYMGPGPFFEMAPETRPCRECGKKRIEEVYEYDLG
jgi:hypothetical protein